MGMYAKLRRSVLTPNASATSLDVRGFHVKNAHAREVLETIGKSFLLGYGCAAEASVPTDAERDLEQLPVRYKGFAYEGAAMCLAVRDGLPLSRGGMVEQFLTGRADKHIYMAYVGVGWAMARLPRFRWSTLHAPDPLLRWLVLDGYGFHQAYFKTKRYVDDAYVEAGFPWPSDGQRWYSPRAIDQGVGRAMWFVGGADPEVVLSMVRKFDPSRWPDLFAGLGLAATYAGGATEDELKFLCDSAGECRAQLAQGAAFAAGARVRADLVVEHNELGTQVLCGMSVADASKVTDEALIDLPDDDIDSEGGMPSYEVWRQRIAEKLVPVQES